MLCKKYRLISKITYLNTVTVMTTLLDFVNEFRKF